MYIYIYMYIYMCIYICIFIHQYYPIKKKLIIRTFLPHWLFQTLNAGLPHGVVAQGDGLAQSIASLTQPESNKSLYSDVVWYSLMLFNLLYLLYLWSTNTSVYIYIYNKIHQCILCNYIYSMYVYIYTHTCQTNELVQHSVPSKAYDLTSRSPQKWPCRKDKSTMSSIVNWLNQLKSSLSLSNQVNPLVKSVKTL